MASAEAAFPPRSTPTIEANSPKLCDIPIPVISGASTTLAVYSFGLFKATIIPITANIPIYNAKSFFSWKIFLNISMMSSSLVTFDVFILKRIFYKIT